MREQLNVPLINPQLARFKIPGLELPRTVYLGSLATPVLILMMAGLLFVATKGQLAFVLGPVGLLLNVVCVSLFAMHNARVKGSEYTIEREKEIRAFAYVFGPIAAICSTFGFVALSMMPPPVTYIPLAVGGCALLACFADFRDGVRDWFRYQNTNLPGVLNHIAGPMPLRVLFFMALCLALPMTGHISIFLPVCNAAVVLVLTTPGDYGKLSRYDATAVRLHAVYPDALLLGWLLDGSPLFWRMSLNQGHVEIYGPNRSGKSSLILAPLIAMVRWIPRCSAVVTDMKGHLHDLYGAAVATGLPVHVITNVIGEHTRTFVLFKQDFWKRLNDSARASLLCMVLNLDHGDEYGESWFKEAILFIATKSQHGLDVEDWGQLADRVLVAVSDDDVPSKIREAANHIFASSWRLSHEPLLNDNSVPTYMLTDIFRSPQALVVFLSVRHGRDTPADIARLIMCCSPAASEFVERELRKAGSTEGPCSCLNAFDEFQLAAAKNAQFIFQTLASRGCMAAPTAQGAGDLEQKKNNLEDTIHKNAVMRIDFSLESCEELLGLKTRGGTAIDYVHSGKQVVTEEVPLYFGGDRPLKRKKHGMPLHGTEITTSEILGDRIDVNTALFVSNEPLMAFVTFKRSDGLNNYGGQVLIAELAHHISKDEFERRCKMPFARTSDMVLNTERQSEPPHGNGNGAALPPPHTPPSRPVEHINKPRKKKRY